MNLKIVVDFIFNLREKMLELGEKMFVFFW